MPERPAARAPAPLDGLRRAVARLGARAAAHGVDDPTPAATVRAAPAAAAAVHAPAPAPAAVTHAVAPPAARARGAEAASGDTAVHAVGATVAPRVGAVAPVAPVAGTARVAPLPPRARARRAGGAIASPAVRSARGPAGPRVRTPGRAAGVRARTFVVAPRPWERLGAARLGAARAALVAAAGGEGDDLEFIGVYGPLPLGAVEAAGAGDDRRATVRMAAGAAPGARGDLALARLPGRDAIIAAAVPWPAAAATVGRSAREALG